MEPEPDSPRRQSRQTEPSGFGINADTKHAPEELKVVYLRDHLSKEYVFPFELCRSKEDTEPLWKEIYTKHHDQSWLDKVTKGEYGVLIAGATVLPSVWSALVRPNVTLQIEFRGGLFSSNPVPPVWDSRTARHERDIPADYVDNVEDVPAVTFEDDYPRPLVRRQESDLSSSADLSDSATSTSDPSVSPTRPDSPEPPRDPVVPIDTEGNQLSFQVDTKHLQDLIKFTQESGDRNGDTETQSTRKDVGNSQIETFRITRAMVDETQGRSQIQIHILPGPENPHLQPAVASTWYHISASQMDFTHFRDVCLTMPHLSDRLRKLTSEMLIKVHADKVKPFVGGMFIEPGTVLRADESDQPDPQSVIFCCVPYLALQPQSRKSPRADSNIFAQRTLMQAFYPYEPVRERDEEQSYRRFSDNRSENIIYVPNLWVMIIGSSHVVTCGHMLLSKEMVNSMAIIEEDIKQLNLKQIAENKLSNVKFTDWGGRDFIFSLSTCRSYFQMEAKAREIGYMVNNRNYYTKIVLQCRTQEGSFMVTPGNWKDVITRTDLISINLTPVSDDGTAQIGQLSPIVPRDDNDHTTGSLTTVPPFFHWPYQCVSRVEKDYQSAKGPESSIAQQPSSCLEQVEKALKTEILRGSIVNAVDDAFTSTDHYHSLPKASYADARNDFARLRNRYKSVKTAVSGPTFHQITIDTQRRGILEKSIEFFDVTCMICDLFVSDMNESDILGKIWGVMVKVYEYVVKLENYRPSDQHPDGETPSEQANSWLIRPTAKPCLVSLPDSSPEFIKAVGRCKPCRAFRTFSSREDALRHLQRHANTQSEPQKLRKSIQTDHLPHDEPSAQDVPLDSETKAWVIASTEFWHEQTNAGALEILTRACVLAKNILHQAQELAQGVQNEDGRMSELYTLPKELPGTFRAIVVLFMATERALDETDKVRGQYQRLKSSYSVEALPYSKRGLEVLESFKGDAMRSLLVVRLQLCYMARSNPPLDVTKHISRGPEYTCGWLMRRLLFKPLEKHATVGDLYREYISRLQFQVNHRPSKRLLRDLNLIQEELQILTSVNTQQANLVRNYLCVLDDATYEKVIPSRQSMFPYERMLLVACRDNLDLVMEDYQELILRCGPLANRTKQSLEINEEDHGKAIMVFTVVTVIFLPLSFATSYFGMNTVDIRDMDQKQGLFWAVAIPLTFVTVGACLLIGYNGEEIRDMVMWLYRKATGKQERSSGGGGISVPRRKRPLNAQENSSSTTLESGAFPNEAEVIRPRPVFEYDNLAYTSTDWADEDDAWYTAHHAPKYISPPEARTQTYVEQVPMASAPPYRIRHSSARAPRHDPMVRNEYVVVGERPRRDGPSYYHSGPARTDYNVNEWGDLEDPLQDVAPSRRMRISARAPRPEVTIRQPSARAYELERSDDDEARGYKWEKKRPSRHHSRRYPEVRVYYANGEESRGGFRSRER